MVKEIQSLGYFTKTFFTIGITRETLEPKKEIIVSSLGPIIPTLVGIVLIMFSLYLESNFLFMLSILWIINILALLFTDGRSVLFALKDLFLINKFDLEAKESEDLLCGILKVIS